MAASEITLEAVPSISDIPAAEWDACANPVLAAAVEFLRHFKAPL